LFVQMPPTTHPRLTRDEALALERRFLATVEQRRALTLEAAGILDALQRGGGGMWFEGASLGDFAERRGMPAKEARDLTDLSAAMRIDPLLAQVVNSGQAPIHAAATVSRVLSHPELARPGDDWVGWALTESAKRLERRVRRRLEEARAPDGVVVPLSFFVTPQARDNFERAHAIASQKVGRVLSHSQTFEAVVDHYLDEFDDDRVKPGQRRVPDTTHVQGRYIPVSVRREVYARQGRACAVPFCDNELFLQHAHVIAHAKRGSREVDNILLICTQHHTMFDRGIIRLSGTPKRWAFVDRLGRLLGEHIRGGLHDANPTSLARLEEGRSARMCVGATCYLPPEAGAREPPDDPGG
jgi:hypothetical protein